MGIDKREASKRIERLFVVQYLNKHYNTSFAKYTIEDQGEFKFESE